MVGWPALTFAGLRWVVVGLRWPTLAFVGLRQLQTYLVDKFKKKKKKHTWARDVSLLEPPTSLIPLSLSPSGPVVVVVVFSLVGGGGWCKRGGGRSDEIKFELRKFSGQPIFNK